VHWFGIIKVSLRSARCNNKDLCFCFTVVSKSQEIALFVEKCCKCLERRPGDVGKPKVSLSLQKRPDQLILLVPSCSATIALNTKFLLGAKYFDRYHQALSTILKKTE